MTAQQFAEVLADLLADDDEQLDVRSVRTFDAGNVLTTDDGLVVELEDGSEFQLTVVQSVLLAD